MLEETPKNYKLEKEKGNFQQKKLVRIMLFGQLIRRKLSLITIKLEG